MCETAPVCLNRELTSTGLTSVWTCRAHGAGQQSARGKESARGQRSSRGGASARTDGSLEAAGTKIPREVCVRISKVHGGARLWCARFGRIAAGYRVARSSIHGQCHPSVLCCCVRPASLCEDGVSPRTGTPFPLNLQGCLGSGLDWLDL